MGKRLIRAVLHDHMTRKDSEKDSDRPHYYSQFWLDVAAGRRVIGAPKPEDGDVSEVEAPEPVYPRRPLRGGQSDFAESRNGDGRTDTIVHPVAEPIPTPEEFIEPELDADDDELEQEFQQPVADEDIPDMDLTPEEEGEEDYLQDEEEEAEEEEEEDDIGWGGGRGRAKKGKAIRPVKPAPKKTGRREPRRGF